ncbi:ureidoglycolate lyase, partial [Acinetobacter baumannii]
MIMKNIQIQPLTIENFQPFGEVICCDGHDFFHINDAHTERYHALVETEIEGEAKAGISIFRNIKASVLPMEISMLERHPKQKRIVLKYQEYFRLKQAP